MFAKESIRIGGGEGKEGEDRKAFQMITCCKTREGVSKRVQASYDYY
jgi:hypothetical protein